MEATTQTQSIPQKPEAEISGVAPLSAEQAELERKGIELLKALLEIEQEGEAKREIAGTDFGHVMLELRECIKAAGSRDFKARLKELGISYEKARYWIAKVQGKQTNRHKPPEEPIEDEGEFPFDWDSAVAQLEALKNAVFMLMKSELVGSDAFVETLRQLSGLFCYQIVPKGGENDLLQRVRPDGSSVAEGADEKRADSAGSGR
jgi:hypothetical protein